MAGTAGSVGATVAFVEEEGVGFEISFVLPDDPDLVSILIIGGTGSVEELVAGWAGSVFAVSFVEEGPDTFKGAAFVVSDGGIGFVTLLVEADDSVDVLVFFFLCFTGAGGIAAALFVVPV